MVANCMLAGSGASPLHVCHAETHAYIILDEVIRHCCHGCADAAASTAAHRLCEAQKALAASLTSATVGLMFDVCASGNPLTTRPLQRLWHC